MNRLVIIGAGGHGKVIADNALKNGYTDICFVDDNATGSCMGFSIVGTSAELESLDDGRTDFIIGVGNNAIRKRIAEAHNVNWVTLIHPSVQIAVNVTVGKGTVIMAGAVINTCVEIGEHCIINTCAVVEHDNAIEDYAHLSPGVKLSGSVTVGRNTWIGTGASIKNNVEICGKVIVGAGSVVIESITEEGTYAGVPVRKIS